MSVVFFVYLEKKMIASTRLAAHSSIGDATHSGTT